MNGKSIYSTQSNTRAGLLPLAIAATSLVDKEGLVAIQTSTGLSLPTAASSLAMFVILEGAAAGEDAVVQPLTPDENIRIRAQGAGSKGDILVLATGGDLGKVSAFAAQTGVLFSVGIAEEDFVDEQLVLVRPLPRYLTVETAPIAFTGATPVNTAAALTSYGFTQAQADALVANVREIRTALITKGIMAANV